MAESSDQSTVQRRATWVGLRTVRQRPKLVGETDSGEPVFEIRSVRLVLRNDASHFNRLAQCSKCGREVPGAPVLTTADLDRPAHPVICKDCVRTSVASRPLKPETRPDPAPSAAPPPGTEDHAPQPAEPVDDARLSAMEVQLEAALARLAELSEVRPTDAPDAVDAHEAEEAEESRLREELRQGLAEIRAEVLASSEATSARLAALEEQARRSADGLAEVVQAQRGALAALSAALDETRAEVQQLAATESAGGGPDVTALTQLVETLRNDVDAALADPVRAQWPTLVQTVRDLVRGRDHVQGGLDALVAQAKDAEGRVNALTSAVGEVANRVRALELRVQNSVDRLTAPATRPAPA
ncbi:MAG: hypothetical protein M3326_04025, partial [Actinomycetota bacterium]|nr:hypothetical protein [Actinomycetota bacterium]